MSAPTVIVEAAFGLPNDGDFVVGTSLVGGSDVVASGFNPITSSAELVTIQRGRWSQVTDVIDAGDMSVQVLNLDRSFDPRHTSSPYFGRVRPGVGVRVRAQAASLSPRTLMTGSADGVEFEYDVSGRSVTIFRCTDALGELGASEFDAWTSTGTSVFEKLTAICERSEVSFPTPRTSFDPGLELLQADNVSWGSNVLNYAQLIARSELGYLFVDADGVLTFRDRNVAAGVSSALTFSDTSTSDYLLDGSGAIVVDGDGLPIVGAGGVAIPYNSIAAKFGEFLFSRVSVDREGGTQQTVEVADIDTWKAQNGTPRTLSLPDTLLASDAQSLALAEYLLSQYSTPKYQISEVSVDLAGLPWPDQDAVLALDIANVVSVEFTPNGTGDPITQTLLVQGISHDISPASHVVRLSLIATPIDLFIVGSSLVGGPDLVAF